MIPKRLAAHRKPPLAIHAVCRDRWSSDAALKKQPGACSVLSLASCFRQVPGPFFASCVRWRAAWATYGHNACAVQRTAHHRTGE